VGGRIKESTIRRGLATAFPGGSFHQLSERKGGRHVQEKEKRKGNNRWLEGGGKKARSLKKRSFSLLHLKNDSVSHIPITEMGIKEGKKHLANSPGHQLFEVNEISYTSTSKE